MSMYGRYKYIVFLFFVLTSVHTSIAVIEDTESLKIRSGIIKYWEKNFYLEEDDLRRIYAELERAGRELDVRTKVVLRVAREDERFYETTKLEDVLSDAQSKDRRIEYLRIELRIVEPEKVRDPWEPLYYAYVELAIKGETKAKLTISHNDRNWSLILADTLDAQIERVFRSKYTPWWLIIAFIVSLFAISHRLLKITVKKYKFTNISRHVLSEPTLYMILMIGIGYAMARFVIPSNFYMKCFGPESGFLWGEYGKILMEREAFRENIFWLVIIGTPISIIVNIIAAILMTEKSTTEN